MGVGVLGGGAAGKGAAAEELGAVVLVGGVLALLLEVGDAGSELGEVLLEALGALKGLFLLLGDNLLAGELAVVVDGFGEGGKRGREAANLGGRQEVRLRGRREAVDLGPQRLALPERRVVRDVLSGV